MIKPKVSTNTSYTAEEKRKMVLNVLNEHPEGIYPKIISYYTRININTVKSILIKLRIENKATQKEGLRGLYFLVENSAQGSIFDWNFHNTTITCLLPGYSGEKISKTFNFGTIKYEFGIGKESKKASMRISSDYPINISSIFACYSFFTYKVKEYANLLPGINEVMVSSIEFNKDYSNLKFEGVNCITLDRLLDQFKIYQKKSGIREEYKLKVPVSFIAIKSMLMNASSSLELTNDMSKIKEDQVTIKKYFRKIIGLLKVVLEKDRRHLLS